MRSGRIVHNLGYFCVTQFIIVESNIIDCAQNNPLTSIRSMGVHFRVLALNVLSDNSCLFFDTQVVRRTTYDALLCLQPFSNFFQGCYVFRMD